MGFKAAKKIYKLKFETAELEGLEVRVRSLSIRKYARMVALAEEMRSENSAPLKVVEEVLLGFTENAVSWNLEDEDDNPIPLELESVKDQDSDLILQIVVSWLDAASGVDTPLPEGSKNGGTSPEQSLGLAAISQSRAS